MLEKINKILKRVFFSSLAFLIIIILLGVSCTKKEEKPKEPQKQTGKMAVLCKNFFQDVLAPTKKVKFFYMETVGWV